MLSDSDGLVFPRILRNIFFESLPHHGGRNRAVIHPQEPAIMLRRSLSQCPDTREEVETEIAGVCVDPYTNHHSPLGGRAEWNCRS